LLPGTGAWHTSLGQPPHWPVRITGCAHLSLHDVTDFPGRTPVGMLPGLALFLHSVQPGFKGEFGRLRPTTKGPFRDLHFLVAMITKAGIAKATMPAASLGR